jgi:hypothetical protein
MAFPSSTGTAHQSLASAWREAQELAASVRNQTQGVRTLAAASGLPAPRILRFTEMLAGSHASFTRIAAIPGIAAYAQAQINDDQVDIVAEFTAMRDAIASVVSWVVTNFPQNGGFLLASSISAQGITTDRQFTPAALATFITQLDALLAAID